MTAATSRQGTLALPDSDTLTDRLRDAGLLDDEQLIEMHNERRRGAGELYALASCTDQIASWGAFARWGDAALLTNHRELRVFATHLMTRRATLSSLCLPWKVASGRFDVLTFDPGRLHPAPDGAGTPEFSMPGVCGPVTLVTPALWRQLFELAYPRALHAHAWLEQDESRALAGLTALGEEPRLTPEARAEAESMRTGMRFVDPRRDPPDPQAARLNLPLMVEHLVYPHHFEGARLMLLTDANKPIRRDDLARLEGFTGYSLGTLLCTAELIQSLIARVAVNLTVKDTRLEDAMKLWEGHRS